MPISSNAARSVKNAAGEVVELRCTYDPATKGGNAPDGRKVKATHALVSAAKTRAGGGARLQPAVCQARAGRGELRRRPQSELARGFERRPARAGDRGDQFIRVDAVRAAGLFHARSGFDAGIVRFSTGPSACAIPLRRKSAARLSDPMRSAADDIVSSIIEKWSAAFSRLDAAALASLYSRHAFFFGSNPSLYPAGTVSRRISMGCRDGDRRPFNSAMSGPSRSALT